MAGFEASLKWTFEELQFLACWLWLHFTATLSLGFLFLALPTIFLSLLSV